MLRKFRLILARKRPFLIAAALMITAVTLVVGLPILGYLHQPKVRIPADVQRGQPTYWCIGDTAEEATRFRTMVFEDGFQYTVHEKPLVAPSQRPSAPGPLRLDQLDPRAPFLSPHGEMKLLAFAASENRAFGLKSGWKQEGALFGPDLEPLRDDARADLEEVVGGQEQLRRYMELSFDQASLASMTLLFTAEGAGKIPLPNVRLKDAKTNWMMSGRCRSEILCEDPLLMALSVPIRGASSGTSNLSIEWGTERLEEDLPLKVGARCNLGGAMIEVTAINMIEGTTSEPQADNPFGYIERARVGTPLREKHREKYRVELKGKGSLMGVSVDPYSHGGSNPFALGSGWGWEAQDDHYGSLIVNYPPSEASRIKLSTTRQWSDTTLQFPYLPGLPEENRDLDDFMAAKLPALRIKNDSAMRAVLGAAFQAEFLPNWARLGLDSLPMSFPAGTAGELLAWYRKHLPPHSLGVTTDPIAGGMWLRAALPNTIMASRYPVTSWMLVHRWWLSYGLVALAGVVLLLKGFAMLMGTGVRWSLRRRGFDSLTLFDAEELWLRLHFRVRHIRHHDELAVVPGVNVRDMESIERFVRERLGKPMMGGIRRFFLRKRPIGVAKWIMALGGILGITMPIMSMVNRPTVHIPADFPRSEDVPTPQKYFQEGAGSLSKVYEAEFQHAVRGIPLGRAPDENPWHELLPLGKAVVSAPEAEFQSPNGTMKLLAISMCKKLGLGQHWDWREGSWFGPDMAPLDASRRSEIEQLTGGRVKFLNLSELEFQWDSFSSMTLIFSTEAQDPMQPEAVAYDARNGWRVSSREFYQHQRREKRPGIIACRVPMRGVYTGATNVCLRWPGRQETMIVPLEEGWQASLSGSPITLKNIRRPNEGGTFNPTIREWTFERRASFDISGIGPSQTSIQSQLIVESESDAGWQEWSVHRNPNNAIECTSRECADTARWVRITWKHDDIGIIIPLSYLPGLPVENRAAGDLTQQSVPQMVFEEAPSYATPRYLSVSSAEWILCDLLEVEHDSDAGRSWFPPRDLPRSCPFPAGTVGEALEQYRTIAPEHSLRVTYDVSKSRIAAAFEPPKRVFKERHPVFAWLVINSHLIGFSILLAGAALLILKWMSMVVGWLLRFKLRRKGYEELSINGCGGTMAPPHRQRPPYPAA